MEINRERFEARIFSWPRIRKFDYMDCEKCVIAAFFLETSNLIAHVGGDDVDLYYDSIEGKLAERIVIPEWVKNLIEPLPCIFSVGQLQDRYISLFSDPRVVEKVEMEKDQPSQVESERV